MGQGHDERGGQTGTGILITKTTAYHETENTWPAGLFGTALRLPARTETNNHHRHTDRRRERHPDCKLLCRIGPEPQHDTPRHHRLAERKLHLPVGERQRADGGLLLRPAP